MKIISLFILVVLTACSMIPFLEKETEDAIDFEKDAIHDEVLLREKHRVA